MSALTPQYLLVVDTICFPSILLYIFIVDGVFGAMMDVSLVNDGPVTITLDSRNSDSPPRSLLTTPTTGDKTDAV